MRIDVVAALPGIVQGPLEHSILKRAALKGLVDIRIHDIRDFSTDKHRQIDDYPFGGGAGMVLKPEPIFDCIEGIQEEAENAGTPVDEVIYLSPDGEMLTQPLANRLSMANHLVILAGHYKGVDQRVRDRLVTREVSIGDYVLSGGELPALVLIDTVVRLVPGVLNDATSALNDSFQDNLLGAPVYTRPASFRDMKVPDVLLSGNHDLVEAWREKQRVARTKERRPGLLDGSGSQNER